MLQRVAEQKPLILAAANHLKLPELPASIKLTDLELESRTQNCLRKSDYARNTRTLSETSVAELLRSKGFGTKCLVDLLTSIEGHIRADGTQRDVLPQGAEAPPRANLKVVRLVRKIERTQGVLTISRTDLRFGEFVRSVAPGVATLKEALQRLRANPRLHEEPGLINQLRQLQLALGAARKLTLEEELALVGAELSARDRDVVFDKLGFDGQGGCTLEEAGNAVGLTRQRVQQLIQRFLRQVQSRGRIYLPTFDRAVATVNSLAPATAAAVEARIKDEGLTTRPFRIEGVLEAARILGCARTFVFDEIEGLRLVLKEGQEELPRQIISTARRITEHWGLGRIADVSEAISEKTGHFVSEALVNAVVLPQKDFQWLDESGGWFWLTSVTRNRVVNQIRKILSAVPAVPIGELRHGVSRPHRMQGVAPPKRVLTEICRRLPECVLDRDVVRRSEALAQDEDLSPTEAVFASVLRKFGGIAQRPALEEACLAAGVGRPMVWRILSYAPWMSKYATGVYGFRGLDVGPEAVAPLIRRAERPRTNKDYGWTKDGKIWLALELSAGIVNSGVFNVPAGLRPHVLGDFEMRDESGLPIGRIRITQNGCWGLLRLFSRRGGEPGDVLLLVFDPATKQVEARLGGKDLFDQAGQNDDAAD
ncbi:MAG: hypothetical protein HY047_14660 [Acidobacteria bacterium]|nr:hypothetical protein [Acidobacteriota bacterium]